MNRKAPKIYVLGGGAAGLTAAIFALRTCPGVSLTVLEHNMKAGRKLLATGNGKCNLSNVQMDAKFYDSFTDNGLISDVLKRFGTEETIRFFQSLGLPVKNRNGWLYPNSEQASSVLKVLLLELERLGAVIRNNTEVLSVEREPDGFLISLRETVFENAPKKKGKPGKKVPAGQTERKEHADFVINCLGGPAGNNLGAGFNGTLIAEELGIRTRRFLPVLTAFKLNESFLSKLSGTRKECSLTLTRIRKNGENPEIFPNSGEVLFTDYGISGIAVMQLSGKVSACPEAEYVLSLNLFPEFGESELGEKLTEHFEKEAVSGRKVCDALSGWLPASLIEVIISGIFQETEPATADLTPADIEKISESFHAFRLRVTGTNGFSQAQAALGGVELGEVTSGLEAAGIPGLFFAGEVLDAAGTCGGYNLQWAWATGSISGTACGMAAKRRLSE